MGNYEIYILSALLVLVILFIVVFVMCLVNGSRLKMLNEYAEDGDLSETIKNYYLKVNDLRKTIHDASDTALASRIAACENRLNCTYSKMCVINFDAFDDVTGRLSFALALLDDTDSGIILTSLYGHSTCNTYIRTVECGASSTKLIDEEKLALAGAVKGEKRVENAE